MKNIDATWWMATKVWWSFAWRGFLLTLGVAMVGGAIVGVVMGLRGFSPDEIQHYSRYVGMIVSIPCSIWAMKMVLKKLSRDYSDVTVEARETSDV